ncbi:B-cell receptor CD22-like, partial [Silurus asotus]
IDFPKNVSVSISPFGEIVEGSSVTLTCSSDANPPVETYTWLMGTTSVGKGKTFTISKISAEDSGEYKCMCSNEVGHQNSTSVTLNVLYPPKRVSVSISISSNQVEESSVTLTCSSDSNPPVETYTWFKDEEASPVGSGQSYRALQSGLYYCEAQNKLGSERSAAVSITITEPAHVLHPSSLQNIGLSAKDDTYAALDPAGRKSDDVYHTLAVSVTCGILITLLLLPVATRTLFLKTHCVLNKDSSGCLDAQLKLRLSGEIVEGSSVTLTCSSDANPPVKTYTWFNRTTSVGKGKTFTISKVSAKDSGKYKCMCSNKVGHQNSTSVTLNVVYPPKNVSISPSGEKVKKNSVTLTCSSDSNPPVENYTWFKENETSPVGSGQSYRALQSGLYYCEVQNKLGSERSAAVSITITG